MATPLIRPRPSERGFTMVEMLMAAIILGIGVMGLTVLQTMAIRTAGSGARMAQAVKLGDGILEAIANEGRTRRLAFQYSSLPGGGLATVYFQDGFARENRYYDIAVNQLGKDSSATPNPPAGTVFTATVTPVVLTGQPTAISGMAVKTFQVQVQYVDSVQSGGTSTAVTRTARMTRTVGYANS